MSYHFPAGAAPDGPLESETLLFMDLGRCA
jgi:hypothetical protein